MTACSVVDECGKPATMQVAVPCHACRDDAATARSEHSALAKQREAQQTVVDRVVAVCAAEERPPTDAEITTVQVAEAAIAAAAAAQSRLKLTVQALDDKHTHPAFACKAHEHLLPGG